MTDADSKKLEGEKCDKCGKRYLTVYRVPDSVWQNVHPHSPAGLLCPECCDEVVRDTGNTLYWEAELGQFPIDKLHAEVKEQDREIERLKEAYRSVYYSLFAKWRDYYCPICGARNEEDCRLDCPWKRLKIIAIGNQP